MITRRLFSLGLLAAPAIIRTPGLLMPVKPLAEVWPVDIVGTARGVAHTIGEPSYAYSITAVWEAAQPATVILPPALITDVPTHIRNNSGGVMTVYVGQETFFVPAHETAVFARLPGNPWKIVVA